MYAYNLSFAGQQYNYAATVAIVMGVVTAIIAYVVQLRGSREADCDDPRPSVPCAARDRRRAAAPEHRRLRRAVDPAHRADGAVRASTRWCRWPGC